jgi:hypothetical protein
MKTQAFFVELLKQHCPPHLHLAEELSSVLNISSDSVYRRLRCETEIGLEETIKICERFDISLSVLQEMQKNTVAFRINPLNSSEDSFLNYLKTLYQDIASISAEPGFEICYAAEDLPVYYHFFFPELARFKMVYWNQSLLRSEAITARKVEEVTLPSAWFEQATLAREAYWMAPATEIWNADTLKCTVEQIRYFWESGFFIDNQLPLLLCKELHALLDAVAQQAELGFKVNALTGAVSEARYRLYGSDLMIGNNTVLVSSDRSISSYIGYHSINFMRSKNADFIRSTQHWMQNLISKSHPLSQVSERQRYQFFLRVRSCVDQLQQQLEKG